MSPSPILSPSDEEEDKAEAIDSDEEEERLLTQPPDAEADKAEAIDLTVESEAANTKRSGPSKRKVITITPGNKTPNKKKQHSDISDADLDAQLKQVSTFNANDSLLHAATKATSPRKQSSTFPCPFWAISHPNGGRASNSWSQANIPSSSPNMSCAYHASSQPILSLD